MIQCFTNESQNVKDFPVWMFKRSSYREMEIINIEPESDKHEETKREHLILCIFCSNYITSPKDSIAINGKYNHAFSNPAGNIFKIRCFSSAKGCINFGDPTIEYTWFPGFTWCYAICSSCYSHLGWFYKSQDSGFYGLILRNLVENL